MEEVKPEQTNELLCPNCKIKFDLNYDFPFAALWQEGEVSGGLMKFVPIVSVAIEFVMLILIIVLLTKK